MQFFKFQDPKNSDEFKEAMNLMQNVLLEHSNSNKVSKSIKIHGLLQNFNIMDL